MRFIKLISMKGTCFAVPIDNIREVCAAGDCSTISTYDNNCYDCQFSCEKVVDLINNTLSYEMREVMTKANKNPRMH